MLCGLMKILLHASAKKPKQAEGFQISHFCWSFLKDIVAVKGLNLEEVVADTEIPGGGGRGSLYLTLHCHHHNNDCSAEMGSDE